MRRNLGNPRTNRLFGVLGIAFLLLVGTSDTHADEIADLNWWSLRPLQRPAIPQGETASESFIRTPIDAFVRQRLDEQGLTPAPEASPAVLIRRLYFDLIGLPPAPEEISRFVGDTRPDAYERLVDRLLASPHYGEKWARHWLDVVHYADTHGYDKDKPRPNAWPYRDYVIRSLNEDKPYSRFVKEQIAGDAIWPGTRDAVIATGFLAAGPWDFIGHVEVPESKIDGRIARHLDRDDMVSSTMNTFCSFTVQCARCHDHKFDPVTQEQYYSLQTVFAALDRTDRPIDEDSPAEQQRAELLRKQEHLQNRVEEAASDTADLEKELELVAKAIEALPPRELVYAGTVHHGEGNFQGTGAQGGRPRIIHLLHRGNILQPQQQVGPGALPIIPRVGWRLDVANPDSESDRRVALADWIVHHDNPLTWRSIVNRVWQYHFGRGIVDSPNDFGRMGETPTHPELLDWLAVEFRDGGQSLKSLHRLIVTSSVYRQSSQHDVANAEQDVDNVYLWRTNRKRLTAEQLRDSVLAVSGQLDRTMFGPGFKLFEIERPEHSPHYEYHLHDPLDARSHRRSIYRFIVRSQPDPFMTSLDCADSSQSVAKRDETNTALQSLALLNDKFMTSMAELFAERLRGEEGHLAEQVERGFFLVTGRRPDKAEIRKLSEYAAEYGLANTCRVMFNLNEFVFVE